jgi:uncharacterized membrane protein SirB2
MIEFYPDARFIHVLTVILSGTLFLARGLLVLAGLPHIALAPVPRYLSMAIDTALLAAAVSLTIMLQQYPLFMGWLTAKVVLLVVYIILGSYALRHGRSRASKAGFFVAAIATFLFIVSIARAHHPLGVLHTLLS